jgi:hypothetical protein
VVISESVAPDMIGLRGAVPYADERREKTPPPRRRRNAGSPLAVGQPLDRLLFERGVVFLAVARLGVVALLAEAFVAFAFFVRLRGAVPLPLPFDRDRFF